MSAPRPTLLAPRQILELYPGIKPRTLRYWLDKARPRHVVRAGQKSTLPGNGLEPAILRKGRLIFIDEEKFLEWLRHGQ